LKVARHRSGEELADGFEVQAFRLVFDDFSTELAGGL